MNETYVCSDLDDLAERVEICAKPLMDILSGNIEKWPKTIREMSDLCKEFGDSERCIRDAARRCAKGLHKTILSSKFLI